MELSEHTLVGIDLAYWRLVCGVHISDRAVNGDRVSKRELLDGYLLSMTTTIWIPGTRLAVDEFMTRFNGGAHEKLLSRRSQFQLE